MVIEVALTTAIEALVTDLIAIIDPVAHGIRILIDIHPIAIRSTAIPPDLALA
ncbi:MAG: hypothetical protein P8L44_18765 [Opitutales bacterium]|nr:hypothetical protein [Opitutales bacterium]